MTEIVPGQLRQLQRRIFAQLSVLTGSRASGQVRITAPVGPDLLISAATYLVPIVDGQWDSSRLYKVAPNPATITSGSVAHGHWIGGDWTIPNGTDGLVDVVSNTGGAAMNLPAGTEFAFDPQPEEVVVDPNVQPRALLEADSTGGSNEHPLIGSALLKRLIFWQTLPQASAAAEFFRASSPMFPAGLLVWIRSQTLQGRTSGGTQGNTRLGVGQRAFRESFQLFFGGGTYTGPEQRQNEGWLAMEAATALLSDQQVNVDMEGLSAMGSGVEITQRALGVADREKFIYQMDFEVNQVVSKAEFRTFGPWLKNRYRASVPGRPAPEPTTPLQLVDATDDMP